MVLVYVYRSQNIQIALWCPLTYLEYNLKRAIKGASCLLTDIIKVFGPLLVVVYVSVAKQEVGRRFAV